MFDLTEIRFLKRIVVGSKNPENLDSETEIQKQVDLLNRCLNDPSKGRIVGIEKTFSQRDIGEHQAVLQAVIYHVGFLRKPAWLDS